MKIVHTIEHPDRKLLELGARLTSLAIAEKKTYALTGLYDEAQSNELGRLFDQIWSQRPLTLAGVKVYAEIVRHWFSDEHPLDEADETGAMAITYLLRAILDDGAPAIVPAQMSR